MNAKKITFLGICISFSIILSYIESMIGPLFSIPGVKMGLANIVIMVLFYKLGTKEATAVSLIRIFLVTLLFGSVVGMFYSLAGAFLSITGMFITKKLNLLSILGVSVVGGVLHNVGQVIIACILMETSQISYYLPFLVISGTLSGILVGYCAFLAIDKLKKFEL